MLQALTPASLRPHAAPLAVAGAGLSLASIQWLADQVRDSRRTHAELESAIQAHERESIDSVSMAPSTPKLTVSSGSRGGRNGRGGQMPTRSSDLALGPMNMTKIPRGPGNRNQIIFDTIKIRLTLTTSSTATVEQNFSWSLNNHPEVSHWTALFDQWCIPLASVTFHSVEAPGSGGNAPELHTAIDFDNGSAIGTLAAIDDYGSCMVQTMSPGSRFTRSVRPCVKPDASGGTGNGVSRMWMDSSVTTTPWYGIRSIFATAPQGGSFIVCEQSLCYAFRNSI